MLIHRDRAAAILLGTAVLLGVIGCGGGGAQSPQAVFDAAQAAAEKEDWKAVCNCFTGQFVDEGAGAYAEFSRFVHDITTGPGGSDAEVEELKGIADVLKSHGLTKEHCAKVKRPDPRDDIAVKKAQQELLAPVKDRGAFMADLLAVRSSLGFGKQLKEILKPTSKLTDVVIDGDSATGTIVMTAGGKEFKWPTKFEKTTGGWKISSGGPAE